uniref:Taste receptor type 2 n=1 Tax=Xenopus tropicalis TaxID=8364 RepID=A0A803KHG7_XENTR
MSLTMEVIKITIIIVTWLCGSILNSSIVAVYLRDWKNGMSLGECDRTILSMGCNNLLLQGCLSVSEFINIFQLYRLFFKEFTVLGCILFLFLSYLSMWLTACLSICYCVKLANISHGLFVRLKRGISTASTLFLFGSVVASCLINVPLIWTMDTEFLENTTADNVIYKLDIKFMSFNIVFGCCVPILVTSLCIGLSVMSLLRHVQRMKNNTSPSWNPQLKSHERACRTMSLVLILNLTFSVTIITLAMGLMNHKDVLVNDILYWSVVLTNPSAAAIVLIFGNTKLKTALSKICC